MKPRRLDERDDRLEVGDGGRDVVGGLARGGRLTRSPVRSVRATDASRACRDVSARPVASGQRSASSRRTLPPMTFADRSVVETGVEQGVGQQDQPVASNGTGTAPSKSEPRADVLDAGDADRVADRRGRCRRPSSPPHAVGQNPIPSTPPVSAIPRAWSSVRLRALSTWPRNAGVRGDDRPRRDGQHVVDRRGRGVRDVDEHAIGPPSAGPSRGRRRSGRPSRRRARSPPNALSKKWLGRHHPEPGVGDDLDVRRVVVQRVRALDREERPP